MDLISYVPYQCISIHLDNIQLVPADAAQTYIIFFVSDIREKIKIYCKENSQVPREIIISWYDIGNVEITRNLREREINRVLIDFIPKCPFKVCALFINKEELQKLDLALDVMYYRVQENKYGKSEQEARKAIRVSSNVEDFDFGLEEDEMNSAEIIENSLQMITAISPLSEEDFGGIIVPETEYEGSNCSERELDNFVEETLSNLKNIAAASQEIEEPQEPSPSDAVSNIAEFVYFEELPVDVVPEKEKDCSPKETIEKIVLLNDEALPVEITENGSSPPEGSKETSKKGKTPKNVFKKLLPKKQMTKETLKKKLPKTKKPKKRLDDSDSDEWTPKAIAKRKRQRKFIPAIEEATHKGLFFSSCSRDILTTTRTRIVSRVNRFGYQLNNSHAPCDSDDSYNSDDFVKTVKEEDEMNSAGSSSAIIPSLYQSIEDNQEEEVRVALSEEITRGFKRTANVVEGQHIQKIHDPEEENIKNLQQMKTESEHAISPLSHVDFGGITVPETEYEGSNYSEGELDNYVEKTLSNLKNIAVASQEIKEPQESSPSDAVSNCAEFVYFEKFPVDVVPEKEKDCSPKEAIENIVLLKDKALPVEITENGNSPPAGSKETSKKGKTPKNVFKKLLPKKQKIKETLEKKLPKAKKPKKRLDDSDSDEWTPKAIAKRKRQRKFIPAIEEATHKGLFFSSCSRDILTTTRTRIVSRVNRFGYQLNNSHAPCDSDDSYNSDDFVNTVKEEDEMNSAALSSAIILSSYQSIEDYQKEEVREAASEEVTRGFKHTANVLEGQNIEEFHDPEDENIKNSQQMKTESEHTISPLSHVDFGGIIVPETEYEGSNCSEGELDNYLEKTLSNLKNIAVASQEIKELQESSPSDAVSNCAEFVYFEELPVDVVPEKENDCSPKEAIEKIVLLKDKALPVEIAENGSSPPEGSKETSKKGKTPKNVFKKLLPKKQKIKETLKKKPKKRLDDSDSDEWTPKSIAKRKRQRKFIPAIEEVTHKGLFFSSCSRDILTTTRTRIVSRVNRFGYQLNNSYSLCDSDDSYDSDDFV